MPSLNQLERLERSASVVTWQVYWFYFGRLSQQF